MTSYQFRMPAGIPGDITRASNAVVEPNLIDQTLPPGLFGRFVKMVAGKVLDLASADPASVVYGIIVRPYPTQTTQASQGLGGGVPALNDPCSILRSGYVNVKLARGTAVRGAQVYVRTTAGSYAIGDIEDTAASGQCVAVANCFYMGAADGSGNVEISYNL